MNYEYLDNRPTEIVSNNEFKRSLQGGIKNTRRQNVLSPLYLREERELYHLVCNNSEGQCSF